MAKNQPVGTNKWLWSLYYQPKPCIITWGNLSKLPCIHPEIWPFLRPPGVTPKNLGWGDPHRWIPHHQTLPPHRHSVTCKGFKGVRGGVKAGVGLAKKTVVTFVGYPQTGWLVEDLPKLG